MSDPAQPRPPLKKPGSTDINDFKADCLILKAAIEDPSQNDAIALPPSAKVVVLNLISQDPEKRGDLAAIRESPMLSDLGLPEQGAKVEQIEDWCAQQHK